MHLGRGPWNCKLQKLEAPEMQGTPEPRGVQEQGPVERQGLSSWQQETQEQRTWKQQEPQEWRTQERQELKVPNLQELKALQYQELAVAVNLILLGILTVFTEVGLGAGENMKGGSGVAEDSGQDEMDISGSGDTGNSGPGDMRTVGGGVSVRAHTGSNDSRTDETGDSEVATL